MRELLRMLLLRCLRGIVGRELGGPDLLVIERELTDLDLEDVFDADELGIDPEERFDA